MNGGSELPTGAPCRPNISPAGEGMRRRLGTGLAVVSAAALVAMVVTHLAVGWRLLLFLPVAGAAVSLLQVRRHTCVARASEGTFEHDDFSTTPAAADDVRASRAVSRGILRDSILMGLAAAGVAVGLARVGL